MITDDKDFFNRYGISLKYGCGVFKGRHIRLLGLRVQIGEHDFDRWVNSVEEEYDLGRRSEERAFRKRLQELTKRNEK
jgi:hypothetical protein